MDDFLFLVCLLVSASDLFGITSALLLELPLTKTWFSLTYNAFLCILSAIAAIRLERYLQE